MSSWPTRETDLKVAAQLQLSMRHKDSTQPGFITLSREYGCDGRELSQALCNALNQKPGDLEWVQFDRETLLKFADPDLVSEEMLYILEEYGHSDIQGYLQEAMFGKKNQHMAVANLGKLIRMLARRGHVILLGKGSPVFTRDFKTGLHVRLVADLDWRIENHARRWKLSGHDARERVLSNQEKREAFVKQYLGVSIEDPSLYHLILNNALMDTDQMVKTILAAYQAIRK
ncbi:MAG: cytidylate kinase-like family protein [Acidobacteria bacterium]|nr:cytidylate kinase-like family protein [Acidobacteriota bacterium]MCB9397311.1 cytidylate kinase-like family protein [Acidobacteriota bacterium]